MLDKGSVVLGEITTDTIEQEAVMAEDYNDTNISIKVEKILQSYTDIVNRTT